MPGLAGEWRLWRDEGPLEGIAMFDHCERQLDRDMVWMEGGEVGMMSILKSHLLFRARLELLSSSTCVTESAVLRCNHPTPRRI